MRIESVNVRSANCKSTYKVLIFKNDIFNSNTYIYCDENDSNCVVIDPGFSARAIINYLAGNDLMISSVLCTHGHFDHIAGASIFQDEYKCNVYLHTKDIPTLKKNKFLLRILNINHEIKNPQISFIDKDNLKFKLKDLNIEYLFVPGHTPGSCLVKIGNVIFTGDTLYKSGIGLSHLPGENQAILRKSILRIWKHLTKHNFIFPGHGGYGDGFSIRSGNIKLRRFLKKNE
jgi:hydroxyacylglutathione hydrolase